jgi:hypothetical protein
MDTWSAAKEYALAVTAGFNGWVDQFFLPISLDNGMESGHFVRNLFLSSFSFSGEHNLTREISVGIFNPLRNHALFNNKSFSF